jgi:hypothetical protein
MRYFSVRVLFTDLGLEFASSFCSSGFKTKFFINLPTPAWMLNAPTRINISDLISETDQARFSNYEVSDP